MTGDYWPRRRWPPLITGDDWLDPPPTPPADHAPERDPLDLDEYGIAASATSDAAETARKDAQ